MLDYKNLRILRDYLVLNYDRISDSLRMESYIQEVDEGDFIIEDVLDSVRAAKDGGEHWCGSAGCMIGHGLMSGLPELTPEKWTGMADYQVITFGSWLTLSMGDEMSFMFSGQWPDDLEQGIKRIDYILEHRSIPVDWVPHDWEYKL